VLGKVLYFANQRKSAQISAAMHDVEFAIQQQRNIEELMMFLGRRETGRPPVFL
jgi:hypothetical protein